MAKINLVEDFSEVLALCLKHKVKFMVIDGYACGRDKYLQDLKEFS